jgi:hypothetical protein
MLLLGLASAVPLRSESRGTQNHTYCPKILDFQPGRPCPFIYIPQKQGDPVMPPGTGFPFRRLLRLTGLRWRYSNPPPHRLEAVYFLLQNIHKFSSYLTGNRTHLHFVAGTLTTRSQRWSPLGTTALFSHFIKQSKIWLLNCVCNINFGCYLNFSPIFSVIKHQALRTNVRLEVLIHVHLTSSISGFN